MSAVLWPGLENVRDCRLRVRAGCVVVPTLISLITVTRLVGWFGCCFTPTDTEAYKGRLVTLYEHQRVTRAKVSQEDSVEAQRLCIEVEV
jgi:hypothetical protein